MNLLNSQFNDAFVHPSSLFQLFDEHFLDVRDNLITKDFRLFRKGLFDEEAAQDPTKTTIDVANTSSPTLWRRVRVLKVLVEASTGKIKCATTFP